MRHFLLGFPGPLRDRLVAAVLSGSKVATTGLLAEYQRDDEPLARVGERQLLIDSDGRAVAELEITGVRVVPLGEIDLAHARDEGEGHRTVGEWRADHEAFWQGAELRAELGQPDFAVTDATEVVVERFRVVRLLDQPAGGSVR
ncbi:ASCH domain-containing protein [Streptomyces profundus]|uniref:ASCH domain-containing protein n=1 Tax=Streptomyces profundus TaxID=2867410 RepID=UPI001D16B437|nr:ASCH domain-containing protein [Streptomyces sp. MA3_2.13]